MTTTEIRQIMQNCGQSLRAKDFKDFIDWIIKHLSEISLPWIIYVSNSSTKEDEFTNGSMAFPYKTIQEAIDVAKPGNVICIGPGNYTNEIVEINGKNDLVITSYGNVDTGTINITGSNNLFLHNLNVAPDTLNISGGLVYLNDIRNATINTNATTIIESCKNLKALKVTGGKTEIYNSSFITALTTDSIVTINSGALNIYDCINLHIQHTNGNLGLFGNNRFKAINKNIINSTANSGYLRLEGGTCYLDTINTYGIVNKTGTCNYVLTDFILDPDDNYILKGTRIGHSFNSTQTFDNEVRDGYTKHHKGLDGHLNGISDRLVELNIKALRANHIYIAWQGTLEKTRNAVPLDFRRTGLVLTTVNTDTGVTICQEYIGYPLLSTQWIANKNWKEFKGEKGIRLVFCDYSKLIKLQNKTYTTKVDLEADVEDVFGISLEVLFNLMTNFEATIVLYNWINVTFDNSYILVQNVNAVYNSVGDQMVSFEWIDSTVMASVPTMNNCSIVYTPDTSPNPFAGIVYIGHPGEDSTRGHIGMGYAKLDVGGNINNKALTEMPTKTLKGNKQATSEQPQDLGSADIKGIIGDITNNDLANMNALTIKGNNTNAAAKPIDLTVSQVKTMINPQTNSDLATMPTKTLKGNKNATSTTPQDLTKSEVRDILELPQGEIGEIVYFDYNILNSDLAQITDATVWGTRIKNLCGRTWEELLDLAISNKASFYVKYSWNAGRNFQLFPVLHIWGQRSSGISTPNTLSIYYDNISFETIGKYDKRINGTSFMQGMSTPNTFTQKSLKTNIGYPLLDSTSRTIPNLGLSEMPVNTLKGNILATSSNPQDIPIKDLFDAYSGSTLTVIDVETLRDIIYDPVTDTVDKSYTNQVLCDTDIKNIFNLDFKELQDRAIKRKGIFIANNYIDNDPDFTYHSYVESINSDTFYDSSNNWTGGWITFTIPNLDSQIVTNIFVFYSINKITNTFSGQIQQSNTDYGYASLDDDAKVHNQGLSYMPANTFKMNNSNSITTPQDVPVATVKTLLGITGGSSTNMVYGNIEELEKMVTINTYNSKATFDADALKVFGISFDDVIKYIEDGNLPLIWYVPNNGKLTETFINIHCHDYYDGSNVTTYIFDAYNPDVNRLFKTEIKITNTPYQAVITLPQSTKGLAILGAAGSTDHANVVNSGLAVTPPLTIKGNNTNSIAQPKDLTVSEVKSILDIKDNIIWIDYATIIDYDLNGGETTLNKVNMDAALLNIFGKNISELNTYIKEVGILGFKNVEVYIPPLIAYPKTTLTLSNRIEFKYELTIAGSTEINIYIYFNNHFNKKKQYLLISYRENTAAFSIALKDDVSLSNFSTNSLWPSSLTGTVTSGTYNRWAYLKGLKSLDIDISKKIKFKFYVTINFLPTITSTLGYNSEKYIFEVFRTLSTSDDGYTITPYMASGTWGTNVIAPMVLVTEYDDTDDTLYFTIKGLINFTSYNLVSQIPPRAVEVKVYE